MRRPWTCVSPWLRAGGAVVTSAVALTLLAPSPAHAYIDPGYGALVWQALAGAFVGSLFLIRQRVASFVRRFFHGGAKPDSAPHQGEGQP